MILHLDHKQPEQLVIRSHINLMWELNTQDNSTHVDYCGQFVCRDKLSTVLHLGIQSHANNAICPAYRCNKGKEASN